MKRDHRFDFSRILVLAMAGTCLFVGRVEAIGTKLDGFENVPLFDPSDVSLQGAQVAVQEALALVLQGQYDASIQKVRDVLKKSPSLAVAHEVLGIGLTKKGQLDEGLKSFQKALELEPDRNTALTKMGDVYLAKNELARAKNCFLRAVAMRPDDRLAHQRLGLILEQEKEIPAAIQHFEQGLIGTPKEYIGIKIDLGRLYNETRQFTKTLDLLKPVVQPTTPIAMAHIILGTAYYGLGKSAESMACFETARKVEPDAAQARVALGIGYRNSKDYPKSLKELEEAVKLKPD